MSLTQRFQIYGFLFCFMFLILTYIAYTQFQCQHTLAPVNIKAAKTKLVNKTTPLIFIGGVPRSGTTLMRALLDAHPAIRCGEETRVIPKLLTMRNNIELSKMEKRLFLNAGITNKLLDSAVANFVSEIIAEHSYAAPMLCNKDPYTLQSTIYLSYLFPNSKFLLMVRDGRAVVHSIITRKVSIASFNLRDGSQCLQRWSQTIEEMYTQCIRVGPKRCMPVYYEQLVLFKEDWMHRILNFLEIPWDDSVLHHEDFIGKPDGIPVSKTELSTDQIIKPVNTDALWTWIGFFNTEVIDDMQKLAPMLQVLGYDPDADHPDYANPDDQVRENTLHLKANHDFWKTKPRTIFDKPPYNNSL